MFGHRSLQCFTCLLLCAACVPLAHTPPDSKVVTVEGAGGRLSAPQSAAVVARAVAPAPDPAAATKLVHMMEGLGSEPLYKDNEVKLLVDGPDTYQSMIEAIDSARSTIDLETYLFNNDKVGRLFADLLLQKAKDGVRIRVLYDGIGSLDAPRELFDQLRDAGAEVIAFNGINPMAGGNPLKLNNRDHRKLLVVDDTVAFTGGVNIDHNYFTSSSGEPARSRKPGWRDTHVRIRGPAVEGCRLLFLANWQRAGGKARDSDAASSSSPQKAGNALVRVLSSVGGQGKLSPIREAYVLAIENASERISITQPYFAPDPEFLRMLEAAARRGVDVRIVLPSRSDWSIALHASRHRYGPLLKAGVHIFESRDAMVHAKTAVIDDIWSTVGSSNLDYRSFIHNDEINAVVVDAEFGTELEGLFEADVANSDEITREAWSKRSWFAGMEDSVSSWVTYWF